jgi:hypothetical protein
MDWIHVAQERYQWQSLVHKVTNIRVQYDLGGFLEQLSIFMFVPCIVWLSKTDQHYALIITPLFDTHAPTCLGIHVPSSGSFLCPYELLEARNGYAVSHIQ